MTEQREHHRIHTIFTRSRFLHVEDALEIGKIRLFAGQYQAGQGMNGHAIHYMDVDDARVVFLDLLNWTLEKYMEFKGNGQGDRPVSRTLKIKVKRDEAKVVFELANGPGQVIGQGAVRPAGEPDVEVAVMMDRDQARRVAAATLAYIRAWDVVSLARSPRSRLFPETIGDSRGHIRICRRHPSE